MSQRATFLIATVTGLASLAGCSGSDSSAPGDAAVDSVPPVDACPGMVCSGTCVDTDLDKLNCGSCDNACQSGAVCDTGACACPDFIPASRTQPFQDMILPPGETGVANTAIAIGPFTTSAGIHILAVGFDPVNTPLNTALTLTGAQAAPFIGAGYNLDLSTKTAEAAYFVTTGSVTFTEACGRGVKGVLTGGHFQAVASLEHPTVDPAGCGYDIPSLTFSIGVTCPVPTTPP